MAGVTQHKKEGDEGLESWLITYADGITLILLFFLLLLSTAKFDIGKYETMAQGISKDIANKDIDSPIALLKIDLQDVVYNLQADKIVTVSIDDRGVVIELASSAFFRPASADFQEQGVPLLQKMSEKLLNPRFQGFVIEVEGHTDDEPISTAQYPSNWELSAVRAIRVVRFLVDRGMGVERLKATGYAETRPKVANRDQTGNALRDNQTQNRRVTIRAYPLLPEERKELDARRDLLDMGKQGAARPRPAAAAQPATAAAPAATPAR